LKHIDRLSGPVESKERLRVILETLTGERTVSDASERLGIIEARFHCLRQEALEGALSALVPRRAGRPPKVSDAVPARQTELEEQVHDLQLELQAAEVRTEIALTMPHLLKRGKKNAQDGKKRR
jgi:hypothetical protein